VGKDGSMNGDISHAINYHEATKHSEASLATSRNYLDFHNKPIPFKIYLDLPSVPLPTSFPTPDVKALNSVRGIISHRSYGNSKGLTTNSKDSIPSCHGNSIGLPDIAEILFFSAGITREIKYPYGTYYMRAASATGALYPIELYLICDELSDLPAGVYHFSPASFSLTQIRKGMHKNYLAAATADNQKTINSAFTILLTSFSWRNAWKYRARSYRHWFWDSGVIVANLLATTTAMGHPANVIMGFVDDDLSHLLRLEEQRESPVAIVAIGNEQCSNHNVTLDNVQTKVDTLKPAPVPRIRPLSKKGEVNYQEIRDLNEASKLRNKQGVIDWICTAHRHDQLLSTISNYPQRNHQNKAEKFAVISKELDQIVENSRSLKETILWRGSSRRFARTTISLSVLKAILYFSTEAMPIDIFNSESSLIDIYFIANAVDDLEPGAYYYNRKISTTDSNTSIDRVKEIPNSRNISGYLCLGQSLLRDASVVFFLMADLQSVLKYLGNRGYRASQFEAGVIAGRIYLAAYAMRIGASGSTFFDDAVTEVLSPHAKNKSAMIAVGVGIPAYDAKPGMILPTKLSKEQLLTLDFI